MKLVRALRAGLRAFARSWLVNGQDSRASLARGRVVRQSDDLSTIDVEIDEPPMGFVADVPILVGLPAVVRLKAGDTVYVRWWEWDAPEAMVPPQDRPLALTFLPPGQKPQAPDRGPTQ